MLPGTGRTLKRTVIQAALAVVVLIPTAVTTAPAANPAWVIWHEGPTTVGRGEHQRHYVLCVPASDPVDGPLLEVPVPAADAYPMPDPATGLHRYSEGQPCPHPAGER